MKRTFFAAITRRPNGVVSLLALIVISIIISMITKGLSQPKCTAATSQRVGSYYYPWFTIKRWENDRKKLGEPLLGKYDNSLPKIIDQHIDWAKYAGIDYFVYSWLGTDTAAHARETSITNNFLKRTKQRGMTVTPLYETAIALETWRAPDRIDFDRNLRSGEPAGERFITDMLYFSEMASNSSNHLLIDKCPRISIYLTRNIINADQYFVKLRRILKERHQCLDMIADVIFWQDPNRPIVASEKTGKEQWEWLTKNFTGIFGYNLYSNNLVIYRRENGDSQKSFADFFIKAKALNQKAWKDLARASGLQYVYSVQPGYDDRALRGRDRPASTPSVDFLRKDWERITPQLKEGEHVMITSFNEWYEGTAIEPSLAIKDSLLEANKNAVKSAITNSCEE